MKVLQITLAFLLEELNTEVTSCLSDVFSSTSMVTREISFTCKVMHGGGSNILQYSSITSKCSMKVSQTTLAFLVKELTEVTQRLSDVITSISMVTRDILFACKVMHGGGSNKLQYNSISSTCIVQCSETDICRRSLPPVFSQL